MQWKIEKITDNEIYHQLTLTFLVLLTIVSLYLDRSLVFLLVGIIGIYHLCLHLYNRRIGRNLILKIPKQFKKAFPDETLILTIKIKNKSLLPYLNGYISFKIKDHVLNEEYLQSTWRGLNYYQIPVSLPGKSELSLTIPFKTVKRGVGRIKDFNFTFSHLLSFEQLMLYPIEKKFNELIVFPKLQAVDKMREIQNQNPGTSVTVHSPYEDVLQPIGTRDYVSSDPFQRIHWKASAKTQKLQTKIYERNRYIAWTIIVNISDRSSLGNLYTSPKLEKILSEAAYITRNIIKDGHEVEVYLNSDSLVHLPENNDITHLKKILEQLTRVDEGSLIIPVENILYRLYQSQTKSRMIIVIGESDESNNHYINKLISQGNHLFQINDSHIIPVTKGNDMYG
ncbi:DUF58 domain-containing protein [Virgibacillus litoralis]|uniref:DUF58 domain-containing protein n=1 Tax=Virgibacillus litoralis TaxID=578221 RepID=A0ABS4HGY9_9BACI|nr:DUF58 domain-containing protein [Virgibacillus litoralis]MBP1950098.1 hypothetical protein [Virgibacillus litoralis]